jgi:hypothetical protein
MTKYLYTAVLLTASLAGCGHKEKLSTAGPGTLLGDWRLTAYQCNCPAGQPVPNETVMFDVNQHFRLFRNGKLAAEGTYTTGKGSSCTSSTDGTEDIITLTAPSFATYLPKGAYALQGQTLIIDQCSAADGPKYTYTRQ